MESESSSSVTIEAVYSKFDRVLKDAVIGKTVLISSYGLLCLFHLCLFVWLVAMRMNHHFSKSEEEQDASVVRYIIFSSMQVMFLPWMITVGAYLKIKELKKIVNNENLLSAFKANKEGDLESGVDGTELHKKATWRLTKCAFLFCTFGYMFGIALHLKFNFINSYEGLPSVLVCYFSLTSASLFYVSGRMNMNILLRAERRKKKERYQKLAK